MRIGKHLFGLASASLVAMTVAGSRSAIAESKGQSHRIVLEMTSDDPKVWEGVLNNVENVTKSLGKTQIEVVAHGKGLSMMTQSKNEAVRDRMKKNADGGVIFAACENTMRRENVKKEDLVAFAKTVDSGVAEVVRKQEDGWSYLRSGG